MLYININCYSCGCYVGNTNTQPASLLLIKQFTRRLNSARDCATGDGAALSAPPLVLLLESNIGKTLGNYLSNWGQRPESLLVIDEIPDRQAQFIHVGRPLKQVVPVSFFGMSQEAS